MIKEAIGYGSTVDEAKEDAILKLGAKEDDDIQIEIVAIPKKKIMGIFGGSPAEVRVYIELPDKKPEKRAKKNTKSADKVKKTASAKAGKPEKEQEHKAEKQIKKELPEPDYSNAVDESEVPSDSKAKKAICYLRGILTHLGCENLTVKVAETEGGAMIILDGDGLGVVIGHRGETLDALQHLASLAANNSGGGYRINLNIGNYREKRERTLTSLASRISSQVLRTGRSRALEPMNPYERRIIHTAVQGIEGVTSNSVGEGSSRRVVIFPENGTPQHAREERPRRGREGRNRRPSNTVSAVPSREPKSDSDLPLYGKIEPKQIESENQAGGTE